MQLLDSYRVMKNEGIAGTIAGIFHMARRINELCNSPSYIHGFRFYLASGRAQGYRHDPQYDGLRPP